MMPGHSMTQYFYSRFPQTPAQRRRAGARGRRATARNRHTRQRVATAPPRAIARAETTAEAITALDAQFPWLRGAEGGRPNQPAPLPLL